MSLTSKGSMERDLLRETERSLARLGFSSRANGQTFLRPLDGGFAAAHLAFVEHELDIDVTVDVAIRFNAVEDLVNRANTWLSAQEKAKTATLGAELGNLERGSPHRVTVSDGRGVPEAVVRIVNTFEKIGLPYIERYSRREIACETLSRDDRESWLHSPIHVERAKRACALLAILDRRAEIPVLGASVDFQKYWTPGFLNHSPSGPIDVTWITCRALPPSVQPCGRA